MRLEIYGLCVDAPGATFSLWSPWRAMAVEHKLFEAVCALPKVKQEQQPDEVQAHVSDGKIFATAIGTVERILKGWQEEASDTATGERRIWRWMVEADTDASAFDHTGEKASLWAFLRLSIERDEGKAGEDIDLNGFGIRFWRQDEM